MSLPGPRVQQTGGQARLAWGILYFLFALCADLCAQPTSTQPARKLKPLPIELRPLAEVARAWDWPAEARAVVVLANSADPASVALAQRYVQARGLSDQQLCALPMPTRPLLGRASFDQQVRDPFRAWLQAGGWWEADGPGLASSAVRTVVIVRGVPLLVGPTDRAQAGAASDAATVDAEIAAMPARQDGQPGVSPNPYFRARRAFDPGQAVSSLMVCRLDGPSPQIPYAMVDDAIWAEGAGLRQVAVLDTRSLLTLGRGTPWEQALDGQVERAGQLALAAGWAVRIDRAPSSLPADSDLGQPGLLLGWHNPVPYGVFLRRETRLARGAVAVHLAADSAGNLRDPDASWAGVLLQRGAAGTVGLAGAGSLEHAADVEALTARLLAGWSFGMASAAADPCLGGPSVRLGDPLYRPFPHAGGPASDP